MKRNQLLIILFCLLVSLCSCKSIEQKGEVLSLENQEWTLIELNGVSTENEILIDKNPYINFSADKRVSGYSGCNSFSGNYGLRDGKEMHISGLISTRRACLDNGLESKLFKAVELIAEYNIAGNQLILKDKNGNSIAKFEVSKKQNNEETK